MNGTIEYIIEQASNGNITKTIGVELLKRLKMEEHRQKQKEDDMAIIGLGVLLPHAGDHVEFWDHLAMGIDSVMDFPSSRRQDTDHFLNAFKMDGAPAYAKGAFLSNIDQFDAEFFNISPVEAKLMDPHQRLFLQNAWRTLEDAGYGRGKLAQSQTGIYVGYSTDFNQSYKTFVHNVAADQSPLSVAGNIHSIIASRIAYHLDLRGPALLVDTACSSSLVALHLAIQGIRNGDCELALVGGIKLNLLPLKDDSHAGGILSSSEKARTFDDSSDGTGIGEGVISLLIKPLKRARKDGDRIYAVVKGSAINQDGNSIGITAPKASAQEELILQAWKDADIDPETIQFIETHGTGTKLGDPIEVEGITRAFSHFTQKRQFCAVSSVKTNLGHLDHVAGLAGLVKAVLALKNKKLPPGLHFIKPNRNISFIDSPVYVNDKLAPWEESPAPRRCGVSSFGLSGTNCHIVLEEAPGEQVEPIVAAKAKERYLLPISAKSKESLEELIREYYRMIHGSERLDVTGICYTASVGREHHSFRMALVFRDIEQLKNQLNSLIRDSHWESNVYCGIFYGFHRVVSAGSDRHSNTALTKTRIRQLTQEADLWIGNDRHDLEELCKLYTQGAYINWEAYYGSVLHKQAIPLYPFRKTRHWPEVSADSNFERQHNPLTPSLLADSMKLKIYGIRLEYDKQWVLSEHRINGVGVVPGTTYIELIRQITLQLYPGMDIKLEQLTFQIPLSVMEGEGRDAHIWLEEREESTKLTVMSRGDDSDQWVRHCEGTFVCLPHVEASVNLNAIRSRLQESFDFHWNAETGAFEFGQRWNNIRRIWQGNEEVLVELEIPERYRKDGMALHPALLDNAINWANNQIGEGMYLPWIYNHFHIRNNFPERIYSHIRINGEVKAAGETASFHVTLLDAQGNVLADTPNYTIKKAAQLSTSQFKFSHSRYYMKWTNLPVVLPNRTTVGQKVLLLHSESELVDSLRESYSQKGVSVTVLAWQALIKDSITSSRLLNDVTDIVYLLPNEEPEWEAIPPSIEGLFELVKLLSKGNRRQEIILTLLSSRLRATEGVDSLQVDSLHAAAFGLGKTIHEEVPRLRCRAIEWDESTPPEMLLEALMSEPDTYLIRYREGKRQAPLLAEVGIHDLEDHPIEWKSEGIYMITGGLGGIGLELGKYLASSKKVNIAILSRTELPSRDKWNALLNEGGSGKVERAIRAIMEMESTGVNVSIHRADVSCRAELKPVLDDLRSRYGRILGVFHAAGTAGDGFLFHKAKDTFKKVISPKMKGTLLLDELTEWDQPDFMVFFSSVTALTGGIGQGDYTAANAYLDAYALDRNLRGKHTLSINWPAWKEVGMAVDYGVQDQGFLEAISMRDAFQELDALLQKRTGPYGSVLVGKLKHEVVQALADHVYLLGISASLQRLAGNKKPMQGASHKSEFADQDKRDKSELSVVGIVEDGLSETEKVLARIWVNTLELSTMDIHDGFRDLGGDSIIATRLLTAIEKQFGSLVDISDIFTYPSISAMAEYIDRRRNRSVAADDNKGIEPNQGTLTTQEEDEELDKILEKLAKGEISVNEASNVLKLEDDEEWN